MKPSTQEISAKEVRIKGQIQEFEPQEEKFEVDLKEIYDKEILSEETIRYAKNPNIPPYKWGSYRREE